MDELLTNLDQINTLKAVLLLNVKLIKRILIVLLIPVMLCGFVANWDNFLVKEGRIYFFPGLIELIRFFVDKSPIEKKFRISFN